MSNPKGIGVALLAGLVLGYLLGASGTGNAPENVTPAEERVLELERLIRENIPPATRVTGFVEAINQNVIMLSNVVSNSPSTGSLDKLTIVAGAETEIQFATSKSTSVFNQELSEYFEAVEAGATGLSEPEPYIYEAATLADIELGMQIEVGRGEETLDVSGELLALTIDIVSLAPPEPVPSNTIPARDPNVEIIPDSEEDTQ